MLGSCSIIKHFQGLFRNTIRFRFGFASIRFQLLLPMFESALPFRDATFRTAYGIQRCGQMLPQLMGTIIIAYAQQFRMFETEKYEKLQLQRAGALIFSAFDWKNQNRKLFAAISEFSKNFSLPRDIFNNSVVC